MFLLHAKNLSALSAAALEAMDLSKERHYRGRLAECKKRTDQKIIGGFGRCGTCRYP